MCMNFFHKTKKCFSISAEIFRKSLDLVYLVTGLLHVCLLQVRRAVSASHPHITGNIRGVTQIFADFEQGSMNYLCAVIADFIFANIL